MNIAAFRRKMIYTVLIVLILIPLYVLGQPQVTPKSGLTSGGLLSKIRTRYKIGQADLGEIDPASESMRLATLGLRGFAAAALWHKAQYYKTEFYWDRYSATLNQIALLQPHSLNVWDHQAHNLTYNIAIEFDGYKERYEWVKKGIDFLIRGTKYNQHQPILQWTLGIYTGQKIGISDEKKQYRRLFSNDEKYHQHLVEEGLNVFQNEALGSQGKPDHWLVGRLWFEKSYDLVQAGCPCKKSQHIYYSDSPKCQLRYSEAIELEGVLDDRAKFSWSRASQQWKDFGNRDVLTTWGDIIQLNGAKAAEDACNRLQAEFDAMSKPVQTRLYEEAKAKLTQEEKDALNKLEADRSPDEVRMVSYAETKIVPTPMAVAQASPKEIRNQVIDLAAKLTQFKTTLDHVNRYREQVNYTYWDTRAEAEQHQTTLTARRLMYEADQHLVEAKLDEAIEAYNSAWVHWDMVFRRFPVLLTDDVSTDVAASIVQYERILDSKLPESFPLKEFVYYKDQSKNKFLDMRATTWFNAINEDAKNLGAVDDENAERYQKWNEYRKATARGGKPATAKPTPTVTEATPKPVEASKPAESRVEANKSGAVKVEGGDSQPMKAADAEKPASSEQPVAGEPKLPAENGAPQGPKLDRPPSVPNPDGPGDKDVPKN